MYSHIFIFFCLLDLPKLLGSDVKKVSLFRSVLYIYMCNHTSIHIYIGNLQKDSFLITMDIASLYTNIPHNEGINSVTHSLEENKTLSISTRVIVKFLSLILNLNNFTFDDNNYLQIKRCAMGSKCSSSYADIFMGKFETDKIYPLINGKHLCYYRFRDDIFMIWTGEKTLQEFFIKINTLHNSIKFDCKYSKKEITDRNAYLHFNSYHLVKQKENIPFGQFLRAKKICSKKQDAEDSIKGIETKFIQRGYPRNRLHTQKEIVKSINRQDLLQEKDKTPGTRIPFTTIVNKKSPNINLVINKHWHLLRTNPEIASAFSEKPVIAFRRNKNLCDILGQTHLFQKQENHPQETLY